MLLAMVAVSALAVVKPPVVTSVDLRHTSPSMGPYERKVTYSIAVVSFPKEIEKLLTDTKVNGKVTLREYLRLRKGEFVAELKELAQHGPRDQLAEGATISSLTFYCDDGSAISISDLRTVYLKGYYDPTFLELLTTRGSKSVDEPPQQPGPRDTPPVPNGDRATKASAP